MNLQHVQNGRERQKLHALSKSKDVTNDTTKLKQILDVPLN